MAQIIEDIIATDKKAREIISKAKARREQIMNDAAAERERIAKEGLDKLQSLKDRLNDENDSFRKRLYEDTCANLNEKKAALLNEYTKNESFWENEIFSKLTAIK